LTLTKRGRVTRGTYDARSSLSCGRGWAEVSQGREPRGPIFRRVGQYGSDSRPAPGDPPRDGSPVFISRVAAFIGSPDLPRNGQASLLSCGSRAPWSAAPTLGDWRDAVTFYPRAALKRTSETTSGVH